MIGSNAQEMKSANWNSTTGRSPDERRPRGQAGEAGLGDRGVDDAARPELLRKPLVTLKAPPNWPTSSPMMKTSGSRSISLSRARPTASR
jgi:hypothetical protein